MAEPTNPDKQLRPITHLVQSTAANLLSLFAPPKTDAVSDPVAVVLPNSPKPLAFDSDSKSAMKGAESNSWFPSTVRISGLSSNISDTGLMAVSTHFDIPFISKRTPQWLKMFASITNSERNGPVFQFCMDLGDADMNSR